MTDESLTTRSQARTVPDLLRERAGEAPDHAALVADGVATLTYRAWDERSDGIARRLQQVGVVPGDRVALVFDNRGWLDYAAGYV
ncbi:MAG: AMP-binding protein, partial [Actinomycetota bacterium]|nr:AMP-binding protein [Actinomycetota bacterium]